MKKYHLYGLIILVTTLYGCSREFSARPKPYNAALAFAPALTIPLDNTYSLYYRAVDVIEVDMSGHLEKRLVPHGSQNKAAKLVEIEYQFVPADGGKVIYISTVADRFENRYSSNTFLGFDHPNAADFRVFLIGDVTTSHPHTFIFHFKNGKQSDNWTIERNNNQLRLIRIEQLRGNEFEDVFEIKDALAHHADFTRLSNWTLCYLPKEETNPTLVQPFTGAGITYTKDRKRYSLQMQFSNTQVYWKNKYVIYKPD